MDRTLKSISNISSLNENKPESYLDWFKKHALANSENSEKLYFQSLLNYYDSKKPAITFGNDFKEFIQNVNFLFVNDPLYDRLSDLNYDSFEEIKIILPYIVKKLKEVIFYYRQKRKNLKNLQLRKSLIGTENSLNAEFQNLYKNIKNEYITYDKTSFNEISGLRFSFEPLYDFTDYFDDSVNEEYALKIKLLSTNPVFNSLNNFVLLNYLNEDVQSSSETDYSYTNCSETLSGMSDIWSELSEKNSGSQYYFWSGYNPVLGSFNYNFDLKKGENFFYWLSGEYELEKSKQQILSIKLSDIDWKTATADFDLSGSDVIIVNGKNGLEAAWYKKYDNIIVNDDMIVSFDVDKIFKFPYPNMGISGERLVWSGKSVKDDYEYNRGFFPTEDAFLKNKELLKTIYWENDVSVSAVKGIYLNETTLVESGAKAHKLYENADKITIRKNSKDSLNDGIYNDIEERAWLYEMTETEIPILPGNNNIYWPLIRYNDISELTFEYKTGNGIALSSIDVTKHFCGAIAGQTIDEADVIYKLKTYCGPDIEAAWLYNQPLSTLNIFDKDVCDCNDILVKEYTKKQFKLGTIQGNTYFKANPNQFTQFIFSGIGKNKVVNINDLPGFCGHKHDEHCQYNRISLNDLYGISKFNKTIDVNQWKKCNCKAIKWSPFGHRGSKFDEFSSYCDFIVVDDGKEFSFTSWRGRDGKNYKESKDFAWFKLIDSPDAKIGWGVGTWQTYSGEPFQLEYGQEYLYYRTNIDNCDNFDPPYVIIKHCFCSCLTKDEECIERICIPVWRKAQLIDGVWIDTGTITDMEMQSDNFYRYEHKDGFNYSTIKPLLSGQDIPNDFITITPEISAQVTHVERSVTIPSMNFILDVPLVSAQPFWANVELSLNN